MKTDNQVRDRSFDTDFSLAHGLQRSRVSARMRSPMHMEPANDQKRTAAIVVAEHGARWASWVEQFRTDSPDVVVVVQERGESIGKFVTRVRGRLGEIGEGATPLRKAVLVSGGRTDSDAQRSRSTALRAIAASMAGAGGGSVLLDDAGADRFAMAGLAVTVSMLVRGTGVTVAHKPDGPEPQLAA